jgi:hypothetical protein
VPRNGYVPHSTPVRGHLCGDLRCTVEIRKSTAERNLSWNPRILAYLARAANGSCFLTREPHPLLRAYPRAYEATCLLTVKQRCRLALEVFLPSPLPFCATCACNLVRHSQDDGQKSLTLTHLKGRVFRASLKLGILRLSSPRTNYSERSRRSF